MRGQQARRDSGHYSLTRIMQSRMRYVYDFIQRFSMRFSYNLLLPCAPQGVHQSFHVVVIIVNIG